MSRWMKEAEALVDKLSWLAGQAGPGPLGQNLHTLLLAAGSPGPERTAVIAKLIEKLETGWKPKKGPYDGYYTQIGVPSDEELLDALDQTWALFVAEKGLPGAPPTG